MNTYDLVVTGAQLWLPEQSPFTALAVGGGRILALGTDAEILSEAGPDTQHIDAAGRAVLPGFTDAHVHPLAGGRALLGCDLETEHSRGGYARLIRASAQTAGEWVVGSGWFGDVFPGGLPTAEELDALVPDRPAVMTSHDSHGVWVNSRAMQLAGISRDSHDPPAGRIVRDGRGEPTGVLFDTAGELVTRLIPPASKTDMRAALLCAQQHLFSLGITGWHDAILGAYLTLQDSVPTYIDLLASRELRGRVSGSLWWSPGDGPDRLPEMLRRIRAVRDAGFAVSSIKIMQDGICENCTAALLEPYDGVHPEVRGDSVIAPDDLAEITAGLDAQGLRVHFHGVGDRAVRECLDAVEHARQMNGAGQPHQIAHLDVVDPADFPRFKALGVTANLQPLWARDDQGDS
ncbi:amidohydrolase family protein [Leucobacter chromiireducens]|uniref:amidohydrolase family protein n=1 Tax=Leucobacter chromiireducens TaxID=283877 RepID=UPI00192847A4